MDDSADTTPPKRQSNVVGCLALIVIALATVGGCGALLSGGDESSSRPTRTDTSASDASARLACSHWANTFADARDGLLTDAELRGKVQEVHDDARVSTTPGIAGAARAMLAAMTAGNSEAFFVSAEEFASACLDADALR